MPSAWEPAGHKSGHVIGEQILWLEGIGCCGGGKQAEMLSEKCIGYQVVCTKSQGEVGTIEGFLGRGET